MAERTFEQMERQIQRRYYKDMAALARVRRLTACEAVTQSDESLKAVGLVIAVRHLLSKIHGEFTTKLIAERLKAAQPDLPVKRASVSATLKRLADDSEIEVVEVGSGRRASRYQVKEAQKEKGLVAARPNS